MENDNQLYSTKYDKNPDCFIELDGKKIYSIGETPQDHISFQNRWGITKKELTLNEYNFIKLISFDGYQIVNRYFRTLPKLSDMDKVKLKEECAREWTFFNHLDFYMSFDEFLKASKNVFNKGKPLNENLLVFRRQKEPLIKYAENGIYHSDSFLSTSISKNVNPEKYGDYLECIVIPKDRKILYIEAISSTKPEYEILFDKGVDLKLINQKSDYIAFWQLL